jgi:hypothetical protein
MTIGSLEILQTVLWFVNHELADDFSNVKHFKLVLIMRLNSLDKFKSIFSGD